MSAYNRYISYLYSYSNGIKDKNVGFAKTERKNGCIKLWINLKGAYIDEEYVSVYFFVRENDALLGFNVGKIRIHSGMSESKLSLGEEELVRPFENIRGIYIMGSGKNKIFASTWDDFGFDAGKIEVIEYSKEAYKDEENAKTDGEIHIASEPEDNSDADEGVPIWERPIKEAVYVDALGEKMEQKIEPKQHIVDSLIAAKEEILAFCEDEITDCVDIDLNELMMLPEEARVLSNNSFVTHGFFYYHHLLLGKTDENTYVIGVPGVYNRREKMTAGMFGFEYFKFSMRADISVNHFGYWYKEFRY